jgi:hypothetical protein
MENRWATILQTALTTGYGALANFLNMRQVLAHDVKHIYIFVRGRNYPLFHSKFKCLVECAGDRN